MTSRTLRSVLLRAAVCAPALVALAGAAGRQGTTGGAEPRPATFAPAALHGALAAASLLVLALAAISGLFRLAARRDAGRAPRAAAAALEPAARPEGLLGVEALRVAGAAVALLAAALLLAAGLLWRERARERARQAEREAPPAVMAYVPPR